MKPTQSGIRGSHTLKKKKNGTDEFIYKTDTDTENKPVVPRGETGAGGGIN